MKALAIALDPPLGAEWMSRINRDVRFFKDKSPYNAHLSTVVRGHYLHVSGRGLYVGTGMYMPDPTTLQKLRSAMDEESSGRKLVEIIRKLRAKGFTVDSHEYVASVPRRYNADHPRIELLRMKDIHAGKTLDPADVESAKAVKLVERVMGEVAPLQLWLRDYVGTTGCG